MNRILYMWVILCFFSCEMSNKESIPVEDETQSNVLNAGVAVEAFIIKNQTFNKQIISNGKIEAVNKAGLRFNTSNRLLSIKVENGSKVSKNQIIATLESSILATNLDKAEIDFDKARLKLKEEKINYGLTDLSEDSIDSNTLKNIKFKSGYFESRNALKNAQLLFNETILRAPFDGVIANLNDKIGNYVSPNEVFCFVLGQKKLEVKFSILENELEFINRKQSIVMNSFIDEDRVYNGFITEINPLVDENGLIQIIATVDSVDDFLFDGMNVKIIINNPVSDVIVIPKEALVLRSNKEVVFNIVNGLAKWNYIKVEDENSYSYAIKEGLKLNDTIIISGNMNLSHDAKVRIKSIDK